MCGCFSHTPCWRGGAGLQPRHVPWLGIKLVTLCFKGWYSIHWAIPARAVLLSLLHWINTESASPGKPLPQHLLPDKVNVVSMATGTQLPKQEPWGTVGAPEQVQVRVLWAVKAQKPCWSSAAANELCHLVSFPENSSGDQESGGQLEMKAKSDRQRAVESC